MLIWKDDIIKAIIGRMLALKVFLDVIRENSRDEN